MIPQINELNVETGNVSNKHEIILQHAEQYKTEQLIQEGIEVQDQIIMSLERQLKDIESSKQVAVETIAELGRQEDVLKKIADDVEDINEGLKLAVKQLRTIARNLMRDWIIRILCCFVLIAMIVAIIVAASIKPKKALVYPIELLTSDVSSIQQLTLASFIYLILGIVANL